MLLRFKSCFTWMIRSMQPRPCRKPGWFSRTYPLRVEHSWLRTMFAGSSDGVLSLSHWDSSAFSKIGTTTDLHRSSGNCSLAKIDLKSFVNFDVTTTQPKFRRDGDRLFGPAACLASQKTLYLMTSNLDGGHLSICTISRMDLDQLNCSQGCSSKRFSRCFWNLVSDLKLVWSLCLSSASVKQYSQSDDESCDYWRQSRHSQLPYISPPTTVRIRFLESGSAEVWQICASRCMLHPSEHICRHPTE